METWYIDKCTDCRAIYKLSLMCTVLFWSYCTQSFVQVVECVATVYEPFSTINAKYHRRSKMNPTNIYLSGIFLNLIIPYLISTMLHDILSNTQVSHQRVLAFIKRLSTLSLQLSANGAVGVLASIRSFLHVSDSFLNRYKLNPLVLPGVPFSETKCSRGNHIVFL